VSKQTITRVPTLPDPGVDKAEFAQHLRYSLATVGAAYIPVSSISDRTLLGNLRTFFSLNEVQKRLLAEGLSSPWQGVHIPLGEEQLGDNQEDYKEVLDLNLENGTYAQWIRTLKAQRPNQEESNLNVPEGSLRNQRELAAVSQSLFQIFHAFQTQANHVLAAIETAYEQPSGSLVRNHGKNSTLRLLHYPPAPHFKLGSIRLAAHQDYSGITLLWQDSTGGLEILTPDREWVAIDIPPGCIGVIASEVMHRWSGETLHAAPHQVRVTNAQQLQKTRYSIAFFCETNHDCVVQPGSLVKRANPKAEKPIVIQTFLSNKYDQIFSNLNV
jgi:isopenicillin N synthase-like dioxygenase